MICQGCQKKYALMKKIIDGKVYNTETATIIARRNHYSTGNWTGTSYIAITPSGKAFGYHIAYDDRRNNDIWTIASGETIPDGYTTINDAMGKKAIGLGLMEAA